ncbi:hypothetical protein TeGR_g1111 [Tetraparma gracilis]|jgi:cyclophilin family peptidyl-prolyl cis-trans isomerase|uniref:Peptidyl-prolyl cis-trans isomerase n=1 Tax=Tetraparma gracilis TaxID=2962635 RepID=A0ABQ6N6V0_9STRA|nr:hypothetical protein TeGR_g1111 [Tetraparma gracilis]
MDAEYLASLAESGHKLCKFTVTSGDSSTDVYVELVTSVVPKTCASFLSTLLAGGYDGTVFDRVVGGGWVSSSSASPEVEAFPDESFGVAFDEPFTLGMSNSGPHTNQSKFFVTLSPATYLQSKFVAFGRVVKGMEAFTGIAAGELVNERPTAKTGISGAEQLV